MKGKKSVLVGWICSYVIILLIPVAAVFVNYGYSSYVIQKEIIQANELVMDNLKESIDQCLKQEKALYTYIMTNSTFQKTVTDSGKNAQFYYDVCTLQGQIRNYNNYGIKPSYLIYIPDKNYILGNSGTNNSEYYYRTLKLQFPVSESFEEWKEKLGGDYQSQFLVDRYFHYMTDQSCVVYAHSVMNFGNEKVNIFISVPISALEKLTKTLSPGTGLMISINHEPAFVLTSDGMKEVTSEEAFCAEGEERIFEMGTYAGIRRDSGVDSIQYTLIIPTDIFWKETRYTRRVFCISILCTLVAGLICSLFLLRHNFKPVSELVEKTVGSRKKGNEFKLIENAYENLSNENHSMYKRIASQTEIIQSTYLLSVMKGREVDAKEEIFSVKEGQKVALAGIAVPLQDEKQIVHDELMLFTVNNIFLELMDEYLCYRVEEGHYLFYLFLIEGNPEEWKRHCLEEAEYLCTQMREKWGISLTAAVSGTEDKLRDSRFLYQDVVEAFHDARTLGIFGVIDTERKYQSESGKNKLVQNIIEYVEMHYTDTNLNITTIAEGISKSPKYISRVFKEVTKESIMDYVNRIRIGKAQILMRMGDYTAGQISEMVGYASERTFRRAFMKVTGINPGNYADEQGTKKQE